jgi:hypothetical protein
MIPAGRDANDCEFGCGKVAPMAQRGETDEGVRRVPVSFRSLKSASPESGENAPPVRVAHFGETKPRCRRATADRTWYVNTATTVGPAVPPRRSHPLCEIIGRWRARMGDWPTPSMSANSVRRSQYPVPNAVPAHANSTAPLYWGRDAQPCRAARTRPRARTADAHKLLANAALQIGDAQFGVLPEGVREYPIGIKVA